MNKVITINLDGSAFQLDENGHDVLRSYLDQGAEKLAGNPDRDEIIADIERAIADKFRALVGAHKNVVLTKEIEAVIAEMGPMDDGAGAADAGTPDATAGAGRPKDAAAPAGGGEPPPMKRLVKLRHGAMLSGVCNGLGAYLDLDTTLVRLTFALLTVFTGGTCVLVYLVMMLVVPTADAATENAAAHGAPLTAHEFIRRGMAGYYGGKRGFPDREARREWQRQCKRDLRTWKWKFRRETNAWAWNWQRPGVPSARAAAGCNTVASVVSLLHTALTLAWLAALVSLLATGAIFGQLPPAGLPVWVGVILLFLGYQLVVLPLKAARYIVGQQTNTSPARPFFSLWDALAWIGFSLMLAWLMIAHGPEVWDVIKNLPTSLHLKIESGR